MSETKETSKPTTKPIPEPALEDHRPLSDSELDAVSGGVYFEAAWSPTDRGIC